MSTDPTLRQSHRATPPRHGSGVIAKLLTTLYALVVLPVALGLLSFGSSGLQRVVTTSGGGRSLLPEILNGPMATQILLGLGVGILLLMSIVVTGLASSAGMIVAGVLGLGAVLLTAVPSLLLQLYGVRPEFVPAELLDGFFYGVPLVIGPLLGGLGAALAIARRRPRSPWFLSLLGLVLVPLGLLIAMALMFGAHAEGVYAALQRFEADFNPVVALVVAAGAVLLWVVAATTAWSTLASTVMSLLLLTASAAALQPGLVGIPSAVWKVPAGQVAISFLMSGGGIAAVAILLVHTAVLASVRGRARRRLREQPPAEPAVPTDLSGPTDPPPVGQPA